MFGIGLAQMTLSRAILALIRPTHKCAIKSQLHYDINEIYII